MNPLAPSEDEVAVIDTGKESLWNPESEEQAELLVTNKALQESKSLETLLVWQLSERVIWVIASKDGVDWTVSVVKAESLHISPHGHISELGFDQSEVNTIKLSWNFTLNENSETFVQPKALPVGAGNGVTSPRVCDFVSCDVDLRKVTNDDGWWGESKQWVLHATHGEGRRKNDHGVVAPNVVTNVGLSCVEKNFKLS